MLLYIVISVVALAVLLFASDWFIDAAEKIGLAFGISPFIVGVTIVAFGTSLPELATSIASVYGGSSEIVVGNVVGSNVTNILLVLGLTTIFGRSITLNFNIWEIDMPLLLGSAFLMYLAVFDQSLSLIESTVFLIALVAFLINSVQGSKDDSIERQKVQTRDILKLIAGGVLVYLGAEYTIVGIKAIADMTGIGAEFFSLTFIALGTSLPEIVVSIAAAKRGKHAIAVGNVLGSNIFNTYAVMAIPRFMGDLAIPDPIISLGMPVMIIATIIFGAITMSQKISRWEGVMLILFYVIYLVELGKII